MKKYLFTLIALVSFQTAFAQTDNYLIYREYDPNFWVDLTYGQHYDIDIDADSNPDVRYEVFDDKRGSYVITMNGWGACSYRLESFYNPYYEDIVYYDLSLPLNDSTLSYGGMIFAETYTQGPHLYYKVALKYCNGENCFYGWAEFEEIIESNHDLGRFHVAKTCFCAIPNYPLHWGQTSLTEGMVETEDTAFATIHPNPATDQVTITGKDLKSAEVINTLGQRVATVQGKGETLQIDIATQPSGIYFVRITDEQGRKCVRKVVKE